MTSEVWVWVYLPGDAQPTLAARFEHDERGVAGLPVGRLVYGRTYLANPNALDLDPIQLVRTRVSHETTALQGLFGPLQDAMPDDWGRHVIDRLQGAGGRFGLCEYLVRPRDDRVGNLSFSRSRDQAPPQEDFPGLELLPEARAVLRGLEEGRELDPEIQQRLQVVQPNTAMGGARPKLTVQRDGALWMAKFPAKEDRGIAVAKLEAAMLDLARRCGIRTVDAEVIDDDILLVRRFDRARAPDGRGWRRDAFLSARTVFYARPQVQATAETGSYPRLALELRRFSEDFRADQRESFTRMAFNCCIANVDDHDRNHGLLAGDNPGMYRLAPAFDMVPSIPTTRRRFQALVIGAEGSLTTRGNILSDVEAFGLSNREAEEILQYVERTVHEHWVRCLRAHEATDDEVQALARCFEPLPERART